MEKSLFTLGVGIGILAVGMFIVGKKTGLFENDSYLYDEYDTSK